MHKQLMKLSRQVHMKEHIDLWVMHKRDYYTKTMPGESTSKCVCVDS